MHLDGILAASTCGPATGRNQRQGTTKGRFINRKAA